MFLLIFMINTTMINVFSYDIDKYGIDEIKSIVD